METSAGFFNFICYYFCSKKYTYCMRKRLKTLIFLSRQVSRQQQFIKNRHFVKSDIVKCDDKNSNMPAKWLSIAKRDG